MSRAVSSSAVVPLGGLDDFCRLVDSGKLSVVMFTSAFAPKCAAMACNFVEISGCYPEIEFYTVDALTSPDVVREAGVIALPTFAFYEGGELVDCVVGHKRKDLKRTMSLFSPSPPSTPTMATCTSTPFVSARATAAKLEPVAARA